MRPPDFRRAVVSGYDRSEVDEFVSRVLATLADPGANGTVSQTEIVQHRFSQSRPATGYRKYDVDRWLDEAEYELHTRDSN